MSEQKSEIPVTRLIFSQPKLDSPVEMPSAAISGPPLCGPAGESFIKFLTPRPYFNHTSVYSISREGKSVHYQTEQMIGLKDTQIIFTDPGVTNAVFLLRAIPAGAAARASAKFYLAIFDYDGNVQHVSELDLGFEPVETVQLDIDTFLVSGVDLAQSSPRFAIVDDRGTLLRNLAEDKMMPPEKELATMMSSLNMLGMKLGDMPPALQISASLSLFRPLHSAVGVLIVQPGEGGHVVEILKSGEMRSVKLNLPHKQLAQSMIIVKNRWFVRSSLQDSETEWSLFEVDPKTGDPLQRLDLAGVPAATLACATDTGFYGFRWIENKPYLIFANQQ